MPVVTSTLSDALCAGRDRLLAILRKLERVAVAFSGGIDSTVVAKAAYLALGDRAVAVTADSASVPRAELDDARRLAEQIGIRHRLVKTGEFGDPDYVRNDGTRCYHCKSGRGASRRARLICTRSAFASVACGCIRMNWHASRCRLRNSPGWPNRRRAQNWFAGSGSWVFSTLPWISKAFVRAV